MSYVIVSPHASRRRRRVMHLIAGGDALTISENIFERVATVAECVAATVSERAV